MVSFTMKLAGRFGIRSSSLTDILVVLIFEIILKGKFPVNPSAKTPPANVGASMLLLTLVESWQYGDLDEI